MYSTTCCCMQRDVNNTENRVEISDDPMEFRRTLDCDRNDIKH